MNGKNHTASHVARIRIEPYLAEYARNVFSTGRQDGAVRIPDTSDLYHLVYELMDKPRADHKDPVDANLAIVLPKRRVVVDGPVKSPDYYNALSGNSAKLIEVYLRRRFNYEFHELMIENEERGRPQRQIDVVCWFMKSRGIRSISEDALLQNFKRFRARIRSKFVRKPEKKP